MAKVREIAWPDEYKDLKRIEDFMICGICYEYIDTSVMTPCSHNYCSVCIRKYLHYKTHCPTCFHDFFEKDLYVNRSMDGLIYHYLQIREKILSLVENRNVYNTVKQLEQEQIVQPPSTPPVRPARSSQTPKIQKTVLETKQTESKALVGNASIATLVASSSKSVVKGSQSPKIQKIVPETKQTESKVNASIGSPVASSSKSVVSSPIGIKSPKVLPSIAKIFSTPKRKEQPVSQLVANTKTVACPVCKVDISEQHINVHLDACLKREVSQEIVKKETMKKKQSKRPPLPKLVLHVMKESELRKKIKEFGLSTVGDRKTLENRFARYSIIYNAECDKPNPRPVADLIRQCEMEEKQERKMDSFLVAKTTENRLQIERHAKDENKIEEAQKNYRLANKTSFDQLIEEVRNRRKMEREKKQKEQQESLKDNETASTSSKPSTSADTKSITSVSENENSGFEPSSGMVFQDSDSDEACPLQLYRSDNTVKSLSVNLDDSSSCTSTAGSPVKRPQKARTRKSNQLKLSLTTTETKNLYEMDTDEVSSDEVSSSPVIKKNQNRKKIKLSNTLLNKSTASATVEKTNECVENKIRENEARNVCNSIIKDFSFDDPSDDSASEFTDKHQRKKNDQVKKVAVSEKPKNTPNNSIFQEKIESCSAKDLKKQDNCKVLNNGTVDPMFIPPEMFTENDFDEFVNTTIIYNSKDKVEEPQKLEENEKLPPCPNTMLLIKENNAAQKVGENEKPFSSPSISPIKENNAVEKLVDTEKSSPCPNSVSPNEENNAIQKLNENEELLSSSNVILPNKENNAASANESAISRPTRKRNPPTRFKDTQVQIPRRVSREKTPGPSEMTETSQHENELSSSQRSVTSEGGSLKRRRGKQKASSTDQPADDVQNPPKRPVRRRQTVSERNSC